MKNKLSVSVVLILAVFLSGCFINDDVMTDQMGVIVSGGRIERCVGPGIYTDMGFFADLREISSATLTFGVEDPEVLTSDNQPVGVRVTIQARRRSSCDDIKNLLTNWSALVSDEPLVTTVSATAREGMKIGTRAYTLTQLLDDRNGLANAILSQLEQDAEKYSVDIINVTIENIAPSSEYVSLLQQKANYVAQTDAELQRQTVIKQKAANDKLDQEQRAAVLEQQLKAEQAQTNVQVEIARREGEVVKEKNAIYEQNAQAFELEKLRLLQGVLGDKAVIYFVEPGTDLTLLLSQYGQSQVIPVPTQESGVP